MIAIIDGGGANFSSVQFALQRLGADAIVTSDIAVIKTASHVILPGVGTALRAMLLLQEKKLVAVIRDLKQPVLGICLGMQLLFEFSAEGNVDCLGIIPGRVDAMQVSSPLIMPHMGWNRLQHSTRQSPLLQDIKEDNYFYFVHSYACPIVQHTVATAQHGKAFCAVVAKNNFYGVQFHPERSASALAKNC